MKNLLILPSLIFVNLKKEFMDTMEKRKKLHEYIENIDEEIVDNLYSYFQQREGDFADFIKNYNREIDEAMERIDKGFFVTHEDVEKEAEQW